MGKVHSKACGFPIDLLPFPCQLAGVIFIKILVSFIERLQTKYSQLQICNGTKASHMFRKRFLIALRIQLL